MKTEMTSRERILATIERKPVDHLPLTFGGICHGWVQFIHDLYPDLFKRTEYYQELGTDTAIMVEVPWHGPSNDVQVSEWTEKHDDEQWMIKEYNTVKGKIRQTVRKNSEYPHNSIPLFDDYNVPPGRSVKYLVDRNYWQNRGEESNAMDELDKLECILTSRRDEAIDEFYKNVKKMKKYCDEKGIMLTGYLRGVGDPLMWGSGVENTLIAAVEDPDFLHRYIDILSKRDQTNLEILLNAGVDLIIRRGWYESMDFWSPKLYRDFLYNPLKKEIDIAHKSGVKYTYVMNSGYTYLAGYFKELGFDMLSNVEPEKDDLAWTKKELGQHVTMLGGVNNYHVIEMGTEEDVVKAVNEAVDLLSPDGGYILAPSDSILATSATAQRNFYKMIEAWKQLPVNR